MLYHTEKIRPYQWVGGDWFKTHDRALNADHMGLGKTVQAIIGVDKTTPARTLVICPAMVRSVWADEFAAWAKKPVCQIRGGRDRPHGGVVAVSYDLAHRNIDSLLAYKPELVIADESHFTKSRTAKRTKAVAKLSKAADATWFLSGTPAPNHAGDLYTMMKLFGYWDRDHWSFLMRYTRGFTDSYGYKPQENRNVNELRDKLSQFMIRRKPEDVDLELPPIRYYDTKIEPRGKMPPDLVKALEDYGLIVKKALEAGDLSALDGQTGAVSTLRRLIGAAKVIPAASWLHDQMENNNGYKFVVFGVHRVFLMGLRDQLREMGYGTVLVYGGTSADKKDAAVKKFQNNPNCRFFLGNITAAGAGVTLTAANRLVMGEADWVPGNNAQAIKRIHRIGQDLACRIDFLGLDGTIDADVARVCRLKTQLIAEVLD